MKAILFVLLASSVPLAAQTQLPPASTARIDYDRDVKPLLAENCYTCHGDTVQQSGLRLDRRQQALRGGDYGPVIVPGKSAESKMIRRLVDGDGGLKMPPGGPLSSEQIGILRAWIDQGAEFRNDVAEDAPTKPIDPKLAALIAAIRTDTRAAVEPLVARDPEIVKSRDQAGSTPLHHAAGFGSLDTMSLLLDAGADPNAKNRRGSTPLHWAVHNEAKTRLLLSRGATVNARQVEGRTPLFLAASLGNANAVLRLLLQRGADTTLATANGQTALMAAAVRGDVEALGLLIAADADVNAKNGAGETALMFAASDGNPKAVALLLEHGADARVKSKRNETALGNSATAGVAEVTRLLLEHGAEVDVRNIRGFSPLMLAASSDSIPSGSVRLLLAKGANTAYTADYDETALDLAAKRGDTEVTRLLAGAERKQVPAAEISHGSGATQMKSIPDAVESALTLAEKQSYNFIRIGGCNSCHSQDLPSVAAAFARSRGLRAPREIPQLPASMMPEPERIMDLGVIAVTGLAWELFDLGMNGTPANAYTDAAVRYIKAMQTPAGNWSSNESRRPPMSAGDFQAAALAIYAVKHYSRLRDKAETDAVLAKAAAWLERAKPESTQDRAFHLLGLAWASNGSSDLWQASEALTALQRKDGGWSQLPGMDSDAYATGQVLYALNASGEMSPGDPVFRKGIDYLLRTQAADGSWHVKSRSIWLQPYFESGFPYGQDQFISTAGTAWATMALSSTVQLQTTSRR
jgi:ankyrin repeat protein